MGLWTQHYYVLTADDLLCYKKSTSVDLFAMLRNARETSLCKLRRITPLSLFVSCTPSAGDPCTLQLQEREGRTTLLRAASSADAQLWQRAFSTLIAKIKAALDASAALIASGVAADAQPHSLARVESFPSTINPPSLTPSSQPGRSPSLQPLPHPTMPSVPTPSSSVAISSAPMSSAAATNTSAASAPPYAPATATGRVTVVGASAASSVHVTVAPTAAASSSAASAGRRPAARPADGHVAGSVPPPPVMLRPLRSVQTVAVDPAEQVTPFFLRPFLTALSSAVAVSAAAASSAAPLTLSAHAAALPRARTVAEGVPFRRRVALGSLPPHARVLLTLGDGSVVELDEHTLRCGVGADGGVVAKGARPSPTAAAAPAGGSDSEADGGTAGSGRSSSASSVTTRYQRWFPANDPYHQFSVLVRWHRTLPAPRAVLRNARPLLPGLVVPALALLSAVAFAVCGRPDAPLLSYLLPLLTVALASQVITEKAALASLLAHEYTVTVLTLGANDAQHTALSATPASGITAGAPTTVTAPAPGTGTGDNGDGDGLSHPRNRTLSSLGRLDSIDFSSSPIPAAREIRFRSGSSAVRGAAAPGASPAQRGFGRKTSVAEGPLWVGEGGADGGDGAVGDDGEAVAGDVHRTGTLLLSPGAAAQGAPAGASTGDQDAGRLRRRGPAPTRAAAAADGAPARAVTASGDTATEESTESSESDIDDAADAASMLALPLGGGPRAGPTVMAPPAHQGHAHVHQEGGLGHARTRSESRADEHKRILREISRTGAFSSARPAAGAAGVRVSGSGGAPHGTVREEEPGHESGASTDADDWDESANELQAELSADNISAVCGKDKPVTAKSSSRIDAGAAAESNEFPYPSLNRCGSASEFPGLCKGKLRQLGPVHQEAWGGWSEPEDDIIKVRGASYLKDGVKTTAGPHLFRLARMDQWFHPKEKQPGVSRRGDSYTQWYLRQREIDAARGGRPLPPAPQPGEPIFSMKRPPLLVLHFMFPHKGFSSYTAYFEIPGPDGHTTAPWDTPDAPEQRPLQEPSAGTAALLEEFFNGDDAFRNQRVKIVPHLAVGAWLVQRAIGSKPAILGTKITTTYHADERGRWFEIDVDVHSSTMAGYVLQVLRNAAKSMVLDLYFTLEGKKAEELPEQILGGVRLHYLDLDKTRDCTSENNE